MTRSEFIDNITEWWHLINFCNDEDCSVCENVCHDEDIDSMIDNDICSAITDCGMGWREVHYRLGYIDRSYDYYVCEGLMDYRGLDNDDFECYKADVLEWMDNNGVWDEEDEDFDEGDQEPEEPADESDDEDDYQEPEEEFSVTELVSMCSLDVIIQQSEDAKKRANEQVEIDRALAELLPLF